LSQHVLHSNHSNTSRDKEKEKGKDNGAYSNRESNENNCNKKVQDAHYVNNANLNHWNESKNTNAKGRRE